MSRIHSGAATMADILIWQAAHCPDRRAFVCLASGEREAGSVTYAELDGRARGIARALADQGLVGRRVILAYPTCIEFVAALFGCFYAGAIAVPAPVERQRRNSARLRTIIADAGAAALLSLRSVLDQQREVALEDGHRPLGNLFCVATDEVAKSTELDFSVSRDPDAVAMLQYTSGSTANPRGVVITHGNVIANQRALSTVLRSSADDIGVNWLPLYHDMGLIGGVLHTVYFGGFTALLPPLAFVQKPIRWLQAIDRYRATISMGPGFAYDLVAEQSRGPSRVALDLSSWRVAICGGEPIRPHMLERFARTFQPMKFSAKALMPAYGLAEATLIATAAQAGTGLIAHDHTSQVGRRLASCGPPVAGQRVAIVDPTSSSLVAAGAAGEIWLQGPSVAAGYWNRPQESLSSFAARIAGDDSGPWLRTGDLGFMSGAGLVVTGRAKEIIVIRGANFDPFDIETVACETDTALESGGAAAFSVEYEGGELLVLLQETTRNASRSIDVDLPAGKIIDAISRQFGLRLYDLVLVRPRSLPRTTSGKIQRHACKAQYLAGELASWTTVNHPALGRCRLQARLAT